MDTAQRKWVVSDNIILCVRGWGRVNSDPASYGEEVPIGRAPFDRGLSETYQKGRGALREGLPNMYLCVPQGYCI